jgi:outer membrane protein assembly factor BamB
VVYIGSSDGNLYALNANTGEKLWNYATGGGPTSPAVANGVVYIGADVPGCCGESEGENLYALNASTGVKLWSFRPRTKSGAGISPAVANGMVFFGNFNHSLAAFGLGPEDNARDLSPEVSREAAARVGSD